MPGLDRREFLTTLGRVGATGAAAVLAGPAEASSARPRPMPDQRGVLVDLTQCIGCRKCEWACNDANHLPAQALETFEDKTIFREFRRPDAGHYTVVNEVPAGGNLGKAVWAKVQCMHCLDPACSSACLVTAFHRDDTGAVTYDVNRCMGCRYCMVACPFQVPAYEYDNALTPAVRKCTFCQGRLAEGGVPACVEICPPQCLTYGHREDLLALAHSKIDTHPDRYVDHVYGEHEVGGTSWLYVADRSFEEIGLPTLGSDPPPRFTEKLQHGIFKGFVPPLGLYALLGGFAWLFRPRPEDGDAGRAAGAEPEEEEAAPTHHRFFTRGTLALLAVAIVGFLFAAIRFTTGLDTVTNLSDQYPWGLWIAIDVAAGVALAAGGFTTAALAHIFHRERFHPIVRPALLSALLGYTFVVLGLLADLGRYYNVWHPMMPWMWSGHSVLFEVGMCVMTYLTVLYAEFVPIVTERLRGRIHFRGALARFEPAAERFVAVIDRSFRRIMMLLILAGVVLSCLHQSSLGSLVLLAPSKIHPLWYTPILPLLFLVSAISVGFPVVIFESVLSARAFGREPERELLSKLGRIVAAILSIYLLLKIGDLTVRGVWDLAFDGSLAAVMWWIEVGVGVVLPMALLYSERIRNSVRGIFAAASLVIAGVVINRIDVFLVAYRPVYPDRAYFPHVGEFAVTLGLFATLMLVYRLIATHLPVLPRVAESNR